ncbi:response regulator [Dysosmobacter sp.]
MVRVLIVEDERLVQETLVQYIRSASDRYQLVDVTTDAANTAMICKSCKVDLILMDICTANDSSGLTAAKNIKELFPEIKVIMVTSAPEYRFIEKAQEAKADSFWYKDVSESELLHVMDRTMAGERIYPDKTPEITIGQATSYEFTPKELEVLLHLSSGISLQKIADKMGVSVDTVKTHVKHLQEKTGCTGKTQLAILASRSKLVLPEY